MKKIYLPVVLILFAAITGCNNSGTSSASNNSTDSSGSMDEQNLAKNRSIYKAIESGDSATIRSLIADDGVDHQGPNGGDLKGADNIAHMLTDMHNHVKDLKFNVIADAARGDYIFAMVEVDGTAIDNTMGMPAGSSMKGKSVDVVKVKDGKMVEHWGFLDWQDVMKMSAQPKMDSTGKMKK